LERFIEHEVGGSQADGASSRHRARVRCRRGRCLDAEVDEGNDHLSIVRNPRDINCTRESGSRFSVNPVVFRKPGCSAPNILLEMYRDANIRGTNVIYIKEYRSRKLFSRNVCLQLSQTETIAVPDSTQERAKWEESKTRKIVASSFIFILQHKICTNNNSL